METGAGCLSFWFVFADHKNQNQTTAGRPTYVFSRNASTGPCRTHICDVGAPIWGLACVLAPVWHEGKGPRARPLGFPPVAPCEG
eukprot:3712552-Prymnesium_polylepis.1